jgi:TonB family protein
LDSQRASGWAAIAGLVVLALTWLSLPCLSAFAQAELSRKVKTRVAPTYPELARRMNIRGVVRLVVVVSPNGSLKDTKVIGGNPILVTAAQDAVKKWKFEPAQEESVGTVEFRFQPSQ